MKIYNNIEEVINSGQISENSLINADCLDAMKYIKDKSIDLILCDLPYGTTACIWDSVIPFEPLWAEYERIIKDNGAILLFSSQPFTSQLIASNLKLYRYELIWEKSNSSNFIMAKRQPLKYHENIIVFYKKQPTYNPIMTKGKPNHGMGKKIGKKHNNNIFGAEVMTVSNKKDGWKYPKSILKFKSVSRSMLKHPTEKPVALLEYLIKTYTNENEVVLDNCAGSMSTGIACINTNRRVILIEKNKECFNIGRERMLNKEDK